LRVWENEVAFSRPWKFGKIDHLNLRSLKVFENWNNSTKKKFLPESQFFFYPKLLDSCILVILVSFFWWPVHFIAAARTKEALFGHPKYAPAATSIAHALFIKEKMLPLFTSSKEVANKIAQGR